jgi:hypothetical protein
MTSKVEAKRLLSKHQLSSEHTIISSNSLSYSAYDQELEGNVKIILKRYPLLDKLKIRNLLEELDNNTNLAIQILQEEEDACNKILEEKKSEIKMPRKLSIG